METGTAQGRGVVGDGKAGKGFLDLEKEFTVCTLYPRDFMYP